MIDTRRRSQKNGELQLFAGLIKSADCGWSLGHGRRKTKNGYDGYYHCSKNGQGLRQCSMHYIREDVLCAYVLSRLQYWSQQAQQNEEKLLKRLMGATDRERSSPLLPAAVSSASDAPLAAATASTDGDIHEIKGAKPLATTGCGNFQHV